MHEVKIIFLSDLHRFYDFLNFHKAVLLFLSFSFSISLNAQILVNDSEDIVNVVKRLEGIEIKISNITYRFSPGAAKKTAGSFSDVFGYTGLGKGLLLTSGAAKNALGPNNRPSTTQANGDSFQDLELIPFIEDYDPSSTTTEIPLIKTLVRIKRSTIF